MIYSAAAALTSGTIFYVLGQNSGNQPAKPSDHFNRFAIRPFIRLLLINDETIIHYSTLHKAPLAVHEFLDLDLITGNAKRFSGWLTDKNILDSRFAVDKDYYKQAHGTFKLTRGHMAMSSNYMNDQQKRKNANYLSNIIPQYQKQNQGIWNDFQNYCKDLLTKKKCQSVQVISGPIYHSDKLYCQTKEGKEFQQTIQPNLSQTKRKVYLQNFQKHVYYNEEIVLKKHGIIVPPKLYKIIKCNNSNQSYLSSFIFDNVDELSNKGRQKNDYKTSIDQIQCQTGLIFNAHLHGLSELTDYDKSSFS